MIWHGGVWRGGARQGEVSQQSMMINWGRNRGEIRMEETKRETMRVKDMTSGDPVRLILVFAIPLFIGNIFQQIYTMVDTMVVGHFIGDRAISAIGSTSSLYNLMMNLAISMNSGFAIIITQAFGKRDEKKLRQAIAGTAAMNGAITLVVTVITVLFLRPMLRFINIPEGIFEESYQYVLILCIGMFSTIGYNMFAGILRAVGNSRTPLYFLMVASMVNVTLDLLFVAGFQMGVVGAALATVIAQVVSALLCGAAFVRNYKSMLPDKQDFIESKRLWLELLMTGIAMALMICVVNIGNLIFQRANNRLGETVIAAHAAAQKILSTCMQPLATLASAHATFVSQNWGAKKCDRIKLALKKTLTLEVLFGLTGCVLLYTLGGILVRLITGTEDASMLANSVMEMRITGVFLPSLGILFCLRTAMQSMGRKVAPVFSSCLELMMKAIGAVILVPKYGYLGVCVTEPFSWAIMAVFLVAVYVVQRKKIFS